MSAVFLDTSGLIAVVNTDDHWHVQAEAVWQRLIDDSTPLVTTSLVLIELGDGLSHIDRRSLALEVYERLRGPPRVEIVQVTPELERRAWQLFRERSDKEWGVTDCASFVVMTDRGLREALTTDRHFEQAGFVAMLKA